MNGDVSSEEARWEAYQELKATGSCVQHQQRMQMLQSEQQRQRQQVVAALENPQVRDSGADVSEQHN